MVMYQPAKKPARGESERAIQVYQPPADGNARAGMRNSSSQRHVFSTSTSMTSRKATPIHAGRTFRSAWSTFAVEQMYVGLFVIAIIGFLISLALNELERVIIPWKAE